MEANSLYIFSEKKNQRLHYVVSEVIERRLGLKGVVMNDLDEFSRTVGFKLNYSNRKMEGIPGIFPAKILFEKRVQHQEIDIEEKDGLPLIYAASNNELGFDPFAASFYFLSRYEEYLPHRKDVHGRFTADQSLAVQHGCQQRPLVELYTRALEEWLRFHYPKLPVSKPKYGATLSVDVDQLFAVKAKGIIRSLMSLVIDIFKGRLLRRLEVNIGHIKDPNDVYDQVTQLCGEHGLKPIYFFQVGDSSRFDINNPPHLYQVRQRINEISLKADIGLHPSYFSSDKVGRIFSESERLRNITASPVVRSRQHYFRFTLPQTFRELTEAGITDDFSMGFHDVNGFRASTCIPFKLFDLERDETLPLTMHPLAWMDMVAMRTHGSDSEASEELMAINDEVKAVGGTMVTAWHPEVLIVEETSFNTMNILNRFLKAI